MQKYAGEIIYVVEEEARFDDFSEWLPTWAFELETEAHAHCAKLKGTRDTRVTPVAWVPCPPLLPTT